MSDEFQFVRYGQSIVYLFPGQGSQEVGMGAALAAEYPAARSAFEEADDLLGIALSRICFDGPEATLTDTINAQPALLATSVATLRSIQSELGHTQWLPADGSGGNKAPAVVAGHSMGEYTALVAAGALTYADGLRLVRERGRLMKEAGERAPGMMAAVLGLDESQVAAICAETVGDGRIVQVANDNCPGQVVISGNRQGMEQAMAALEQAGARKVIPLAVSVAAHSPLMQPAAEALRSAIEETPIAASVVPVIGNTTAELLTEAGDIRRELVAQLTGSVRWTTSMQRAADLGIEDYVEIGPGDVLAGLMRRIDRGSKRYTINDPAGVKSFVALFAAR